MINRIVYKYLGLLLVILTFSACVPTINGKKVNKKIPKSYANPQDSTNSGKVNWKVFFSDSNLIALIDTALINNQELNIVFQEIGIAKNEVSSRKGEYLPFVDLGVSAGVDKPGRYTSRGASEATTDIEPGREMPDPLQDYMIGAYATWEVDIWRKLRNAKKAAYARYIASVEGKNLLVTNLISEIAQSYFELLAFDNQLLIVKQNIDLQSNALKIVKLQKQAARVNELAVRRFEAQVLKTRSLQFHIQQKIVETENRINFLVGRYPQRVKRSPKAFIDLIPDTICAGIPAQLLTNRPDIRQAEMELEATQLDVKVAKANFYPSLNISAGIGLQAFNPTFLLKAPESILLSLVGDAVAPLINRKAIKAAYFNANAQQIQAVYKYEQAVLKAYIEVANQLSKIDNLQQSYDLQEQQVEALTESINISNELFKSARADYMEVLMTQRDALESKFDLIETKMEQMDALILTYRALGGGWN